VLGYLLERHLAMLDLDDRDARHAHPGAVKRASPVFFTSL
jgi:hypothetical protein